MKNKILALASLFLLLLITQSLNAQSDNEKCRDECDKELDKCIQKADEKYRLCYQKCIGKYQFSYDSVITNSSSGYYLTFCEEACLDRQEIDIESCILDEDLCVNICDAENPCLDCPDGYTYIETSRSCKSNFTIDIDDYDFNEETGYIRRNCQESTENNCCPEGFRLYLAGCTEEIFLEDCRDRILELEDEADYEEAVGNYNDARDIRDEIDEILADPDCYEISNEDCEFCRLSQYELITINKLGNIFIKPICN